MLIYFVILISLTLINANIKAGLRSKLILDEQRLKGDLLENYDPTSLPVEYLAEYNGGINTTMVHLTLQVTALGGINPKEQSFTVFGWVSAYWYDDRLTWDPVDYGNITSMVMEPSSIWLPSYVLDNGAGERVYQEDHYRWFKAIAFYYGEVWWEPGGQYKSDCNINVAFFPFDHQICELQFGNWVYFGSEVNMTYYEEDSVLEPYSNSSEWDILETRVWRTDIYYEGYEEYLYPVVHYEFHLKRKPLYFILNLIVPCIVLSSLVLLVFKLPPDSGEKISMGVTLLLSFSVFILLISEHVPATSDTVPLLVIYLILFMTITGLAVGMSVFILQLHHSDGTTRASYYLRRIALWIAKLLCYRSNFIDFGRNLDGITAKKGRYNPSLVVDESTVPRQEAANNGLERDQGVRNISTDERQDMEVRREMIIKEWKEIAVLFDKLCFWVALVIFVLFNVIMLLLLPLMEQNPEL